MQPSSSVRYGRNAQRLSGIELLSVAEHGSSAFFEGSGDFLGRFHRSELQDDLYTLGLFDFLAQRGYRQVELELTSRPHGPDRLRVHSQSELLIDLSVWREYVRLELMPSARLVPTLGIERLELRHPQASPRVDLAPGQSAPGLGAALHILGLLRSWATRIGAPLILQLPEFFHTGAIFSRTFRYIDPEMQGFFDAAVAQLMPQLVPPASRRPNAPRHSSLEPTPWLQDDGDVLQHWSPLDLTRLSRAFEAGRIRLHGEPWFWPTEAQVLPESSELRALFSTVRWQQARVSAAQSASFTLSGGSEPAHG